MSKQIITLQQITLVSVLVCLLCGLGDTQAATLTVSQKQDVTTSQKVSPTRTAPASRLLTHNKQVKVQLRNRELVLHVYLPEQVTPGAPLVFFSSGSGGWHKFDGQIAAALAARGMPVCGLSTHSYLRAFYSGDRPATPAQIGADYVNLISEARKIAKVDDTHPLLLAGWSLGAGYTALVAADKRIKPMVKGAISVSISRDNETVLNLWHRLLSRVTGRTFGPSFDVTEFLAAAPSVPIAIIQAKGDGSASPHDAQELMNKAVPRGSSPSLRLFTVESARNHSFAGGADEFQRTLDAALEWIGETKSGALIQPPMRDGSLRNSNTIR